MNRWPRGRQLTLGLAAGLMVLLAAIKLLWPEPQGWTEPDGTEVRLLKVTFGPRHEHFPGGIVAWGQQRLASSRWLTKLNLKPPLRFAHSSSTTSLVVWLELRGPGASKHGPRQYWLINPETRLATQSRAIAQHPITAAHTIQAIRFENRPALAGPLVVRMETPATQPNGPPRRHEFHIHNRAMRTESAPALPEIRRQNLAPDTEMELIALETGITAQPQDSDDTPVRWSESRVQLQLSPAQLAPDAWELGHVTASNRFGVILQSNQQLRRRSEASVHFLPDILWSENGPWEIHIPAWRTGSFAATEVWMFEIPAAEVGGGLPPSGGQPLATNTLRHGVVTILGLQPPSQPGSGLELTVQFEPTGPPAELLLLGATNTENQSFALTLGAESRGPEKQVKVFRLHHAATMLPLRGQIALSPIVTTVFRATPTIFPRLPAPASEP